MESLTLKRGSGYHFDGEQWQAVKDDKWFVQKLYVANGREAFMGKRQIGGVEYIVFRCLDDSFFAQPVDICALPVPEDPSEVVFTLEVTENPEEKPEKAKHVVTIGETNAGMLHFDGKNWKLASAKKWKRATQFVSPDLGSSLGEKKIGQFEYSIHKFSAGFLAVRKEA